LELKNKKLLEQKRTHAVQILYFCVPGRGMGGKKTLDCTMPDFFFLLFEIAGVFFFVFEIVLKIPHCADSG